MLYHFNKPVFDFFVVVASIADLIVTNIEGIDTSFLKSFQIIRVLRVLRVTRVLRLFRSLKSLEKLIQTLRWAISALSNVFMALSLLLEGFVNANEMNYVIKLLFQNDYYIMLALNYILFNFIRQKKEVKQNG